MPHVLIHVALDGLDHSFLPALVDPNLPQSYGSYGASEVLYGCQGESSVVSITIQDSSNENVSDERAPSHNLRAESQPPLILADIMGIREKFL